MKQAYRSQFRRSKQKRVKVERFRRVVAGVAEGTAAADRPVLLGDTINSVENRKIVNRLEVEQRLKLVPKACRCYQCAKCARRHLAWRRKEWMRACLADEAFKDGAWTLTVTVDRDGTDTGHRWGSPESAYEHVTKERIIWRLLDHLGVARGAWFYAVEWQMKTRDERGSGWPHWHIILPGPVDVEKAAEWLGKRMVSRSVGPGVHLRGPNDQPKEKIINYLSGYLSKGGDVGEWVLPRERMRTVSASRSAGLPRFADYCHRSGRSEFAEYEKRRDSELVPAVSEGAGAGVARRRTSIGQRIEECGSECIAVNERSMIGLGQFGQVVAEWKEREYIGGVKCNLRAVRRLAGIVGESVEGVQETRVVEWQPDELIGIDRETWTLVDEYGQVDEAWEDDREVYSYVPQTSVVIGERALYVSESLLKHLDLDQGLGSGPCGSGRIIRRSLKDGDDGAARVARSGPLRTGSRLPSFPLAGWRMGGDDVGEGEPKD